MDLPLASALAVQLMGKYGLIDQLWSFKWDGARTRLGQCRYSTRQISMSARLVMANTEDVVRQTIIHEIAHALLDPGHGHDDKWAAMNRHLLDMEGLHDAEVSRIAHGTTPTAARYVGTCGTCGTELRRHRYTKSMRRGDVACHKCCDTFNRGKYDPRFRVEFVDSLATSPGVRYVRPMTTTKCFVCKRRPIDHNTQGRDSSMCTDCYEYAGWENTHNDDAHEKIGADDECLVCLGQDPANAPVRKGHSNKNAAGTQMSHAACKHESTKAARAKCRRDRNVLTESGRCTTPSGEHKFQNDVCERCAAPRPN